MSLRACKAPGAPQPCPHQPTVQGPRPPPSCGAGGAGPHSRDAISALATQKLPIRGLDRIQTLGLRQPQTPPNWSACRERREGAI